MNQPHDPSSPPFSDNKSQPGFQSPCFRNAGSYEAMSRLAMGIIVAELKLRPDMLCCVPAGSTPKRTYELLTGYRDAEPGLFNRVRFIKIDEWGGMKMNHPASCEHSLRIQLLDPLEIPGSRYMGFDSHAADPKAECTRVARWLEGNGPIDLCVLGLGTNGHLAMNEPAEALVARTHVAALAESTLRHPMLDSFEHPPNHGLTLGMTDILQSRKILLLLNGTHKREPLKRLLEPGISTYFPASFLWLHPNTTILCDNNAVDRLATLQTE